jgi:arginyl-tRNA synthetase
LQERAVTWFDHHHRSKKLASAAQSSLRRGDEVTARHLYAQAAQEAEQALAEVSREKQVTLGVIAMSAVRWWRRANRSDDAARVARLIRGASDLFPTTLTPLDGTTSAGTQHRRG